jgi:hypothetical protein
MKAFTLHGSLHAAVLSGTLFAAVQLVMGCGGATPCSYTNVVTVSPTVGSADHLAVAPGDQQQFSAFSQELPPANSSGCAVPNVIAKLTPTWTVSDTVNVKISSAQDATNGLATCIGTTKSPVTVTALGALTAGGATQMLGTATLTCK